MDTRSKLLLDPFLDSQSNEYSREACESWSQIFSVCLNTEIWRIETHETVPERFRESPGKSVRITLKLNVNIADIEADKQAFDAALVEELRRVITLSTIEVHETISVSELIDDSSSASAVAVEFILVSPFGRRKAHFCFKTALKRRL
eukprot:GABV01004013.1.p1 GENE.GABV01004013.1~~GABV01004013.1.p1  ORF type:complete len:167 (-),score=58.02 GABV01004013.1:11-451(-)